MKELFQQIEHKYYIIVCDNKALIETAQAIRHKVYCEEKSYEKITDSKRETDLFDSKSIHFIAFNRKSGKAVATFRVICANILPAEIKMQSFNREKMNGKSIEISRLALLPEERSQSRSRLAVGLFFATLYSSWLLGAENIYMTMERSLAISIKKTGVSPIRITPFYEHNGQRAIYIITIKPNLEHVLSLLPHKNRYLMCHKFCQFNSLDKHYQPIMHN